MEASLGEIEPALTFYRQAGFRLEAVRCLTLIARAKRDLGWTAATHFKEGVRQYVAWRREQAAKAADQEAAAIIPAPDGGVQTTIRRTPATCAGTAHMTSVEMRLRGT